MTRLYFLRDLKERRGVLCPCMAFFLFGAFGIMFFRIGLFESADGNYFVPQGLIIRFC